MTTARRQIITGIQNINSDYGPYRFRRDIASVISSMIGAGPKVERTIQRMTDLGILQWSKTGCMAKIVDPDTSYRIMMCSEGGTRRVMYTGLTEEAAYDICRDYGWRAAPDGGFEWRLEIEEE